MKDAVPDAAEPKAVAPEPTAPKVAKPIKPVEIPGVEWVRVVPDRHGLEEVSFEVPTSWKQKKGIWVVRKGENPETGLKVDIDKFKQEDPEKAAKAFPDSSAIKRTINGTEVDIISRKQTIRKIDFTIRIAAFGAPMFAVKERLIMMFSSDNIKRDAPIFEHTMQTVKSNHEPEKSVAEKEMALGATPLKLVKIEPGKAGELEGALKLLYNDGARDGTKYSVVMVDLDNDGIEEAIIHINQPYGYCNDNEGTCRIVVMKRDTSQKWDYVTFRNGFYAKSVSLLSSSSNGYRDLAFAGELYTFNGDSYQREKSVDVKKISPAEAGSASAENAAKQTEKVVVPEDVGTKPVITLPKPATKTPNIEWVRVTSANKELKGISFDVPKNWPRIGDFDTWTKKTGSKIDVQLDMGFTRPKDMESTDAKAHLKKFISRKSVINGIFVEILTAAPQTTRQTAPVTKSIPVSRRKYHSPARGTSERKAIMNAARIPISKALGQKVIFVVSVLRSDGRWAYLQAVPHRPNGRKLNWSKTPYASDWKNDAMSNVVMVLLRKDGRKWKAIDHVIGPTDVHWVSWLDQYGLPQSLYSAR